MELLNLQTETATQGRPVAGKKRTMMLQIGLLTVIQAISFLSFLKLLSEKMDEGTLNNFFWKMLNATG